MKKSKNATADQPQVGCDAGLGEWVWTREKPTKCGYYWVKSRLHYKRITRFIISPVIGDSSHIEPQDGPLSTQGWEWFCGPIPSPNAEAIHGEKGATP